MAPEPQQQRRGIPAASQTQTITSLSSQPQTGTQNVLRLRGAHGPSRRRIQWAEDVVDNEGLGRKKSKVCCIYHRPKAVDESSDESSSSSDSSSDESDFGEGGRRRIPSGDGKGKGKNRGRKCDDDDHDHDHDHDHYHNHDHDSGPARKKQQHGESSEGKGKEKAKRRPSPNAYERVPKPPKPKDASADKSGP